MDPERYNRISGIVDKARTLPTGKVDAFVDEACAGDAELRREVKSHLLQDASAMAGTTERAAGSAGHRGGLAPGSRFSSYMIEALEGRGGMGVVYRARDEKLQREVAIKILAPGTLGSDDGRRRFLKEARALAQISHPNILTVYDVDRSENFDFIAMEWVDGKRLDRVIGPNGLPLDDALKYAVQVADALTHAHAKGIVHRDLKPSNVMITAAGFVKVLDFGLARVPSGAAATARTGHEESSTLEGKVFGTAAYMSPEQAQGQPLDCRSDIFSFGSMLYEMLSGRRPFKGEHFISTLAAIIKEEPAPLQRGVPDPLRGVVDRCLRKDPARRFQTMADVKVELEEIREQRLIALGPKWKSLSFAGLIKPGFAGVAILACLLITAGVLWQWSRRTVPPVPSFEVAPVTASTAVEGQPDIAPDGNWIAFSSNASGNSEIYVTDLDGTTRRNITESPAEDTDPAWFPDGSNIAYSSRTEGRPEIRKIRLLGGGSTLLISDAVEPAISPDNLHIAYTQILPNGYRVAVAPLGNPSSATALSGLMTDTGRPAWSPDGRRVCYVENQDLWTSEWAGGARRVRITSDGTHKYDPAWSSDGERIYYCGLMGGRCAIWCVAANGGAPFRVTDGVPEERHPSLSKDGKRLVYATINSRAKLLLLNRLSRAMASLPVNQWALSLPAIAADGSSVVFTPKLSGTEGDLWAEPLKDGIPHGDPTPITERQGNLQHPALSPDGQWIACYRLTGNKREVLVVSSSSGRVLPVCPPQSHTPSWSPDGSMLAFVSLTGTGSEIVTVRVREAVERGDPGQLGARQRVAAGSAMAYGPVWSPDGKRLAFVDGNTGGTDVALVSADGGGAIQQCTRGANAKFVRWDALTGDLLVSGSWGEKRVTLRTVSASGVAAPFAPEIEFGGAQSSGLFDLSRDGKWLVFSNEETAGQIWMLKATKGVF